MALVQQCWGEQVTSTKQSQLGSDVRRTPLAASFLALFRAAGDCSTANLGQAQIFPSLSNLPFTYFSIPLPQFHSHRYYTLIYVISSMFTTCVSGDERKYIVICLRQLLITKRNATATTPICVGICDALSSVVFSLSALYSPGITNLHNNLTLDHIIVTLLL